MSINIIFTNPGYVKKGLYYDIRRGKPGYGQNIRLYGQCMDVKPGGEVSLKVVKMFNVEPRYFTEIITAEQYPVFEWNWEDFVYYEWDIPT